MRTHDINYYLSLPYTIELIREHDTTWFARVAELPGCMTEGDSAADAVDMIQDAMAGWIELALEDGRAIPEPKPLEEFSGKFVVRVPKSLHRDLVAAAAREEVSLNQFIATELARVVGRPLPSSARIAPSTPLRRHMLARTTLHEDHPSYQTEIDSAEPSSER
ncbi:MAG TPA: toxin-antitoxin system HicB family antitoxin [Chloroflexi bacterium]|nr:toxin-antitoxin system HicB family antitoxin [Chloroflexota bacterium]HHW85868.1 toxin-antitoxin system HicB family antitoxin [Chloroflexota bacterium]